MHGRGPEGSGPLSRRKEVFRGAGARLALRRRRLLVRALHDGLAWPGDAARLANGGVLFGSRGPAAAARLVWRGGCRGSRLVQEGRASFPAFPSRPSRPRGRLAKRWVASARCCPAIRTPSRDRGGTLWLETRFFRYYPRLRQRTDKGKEKKRKEKKKRREKEKKRKEKKKKRR